MNTSSKDTPKKKDPQTILLIGPPGGGKTSLLLRFKKLAVIDADVRLDGAENHLRRLLPDLSYDYVTPQYHEGKLVAKENVWDRIKKETELACKDPKYDWIAVDGLSAVNFHLIDWVTGQAKKSVMEQSDWIPFRQQLLYLLNLVKMSGKNYILTCHEEVTADRDGTIKKRTILVDSKLRDAIAGWFSNVWRCYPVPGPAGKTTYKLDTRPTGVDDLKASNVGLAASIDVTSTPSFNFDKDVLSFLV